MSSSVSGKVMQVLSANRKRFQRPEASIGKHLSFMSANSWTAISVIAALIAAYLIARNEFLTGAILFMAAALCDAIDGAVARHKNTAGQRGAYLDTIADRYVEFFIIVGLFFASLPDAFLPAKLWLFFYLFGSMMTTYSKAAAKEKGLTESEMKFGLLERAERLTILFIGMILATVNAAYLTYVIALLAVLSNITAIQRIEKALR